MRIRNALLLIAMILLPAVSTPAAAEDFAEVRFPKGFGMSVSISSTKDLIQSIDDFAVACTKGTKGAVPPGMVSAKMLHDLPFLENMDVEAHLYLPPSASYAALFNHLIVLGNVTLDQMTEILDRIGMDLEKNATGKYYTIKGRGRRSIPYLLHDMGDGYIGIAPNPNMLGMISREIEKGWRPALWSDGGVSFLVDQPGKWLFTSDNINVLTGLAGMWITEEGAKKMQGVNIATLLRLLDMASEAVADMDEEIESIRRLGYAYRVSADKLAVSFRVLADKDSFLGRAGAAMSGASLLDEDSMKRAGEDAFQMLAIADFEAMAPGFNAVLGDAIARLGDEVFPNQKEALTTAYKAYVASTPGRKLLVCGSSDHPLDMAAYLDAKNPAAFIDSRVATVSAMDGIMRTLFPGLLDGDGPVVTVEDGKTADGIAYKRVEWDAEFMSRYRDLLSGSNRRKSNFPEGEEMLRKFTESTILAAGNGFALHMPGELDETRLAAAVKGERAAKPLVDSPAAQAILGELEAKQAMIGLIDINRLLQSFVVAIAEDVGNRGRANPEDVAEKLSNFKAVVKQSDLLSAFGLGGKDGCIIGSVVVPASAINTFVENISNMEGGKLGRRGSEASIKSTLKAYVTAQITFQVGRQGHNAFNTGAGKTGYADNFRNLYFGEVFGLGEVGKYGNSGKAVQLISQKMANAYAGQTAGAPTVSRIESPAEETEPYEGYLFLEPSGIDFADDYALVAYPAKYGETGEKVFWIGQDGMIYEMLLDRRSGGLPEPGSPPVLVTAEERQDVNPDLWSPVE